MAFGYIDDAECRTGPRCNSVLFLVSSNRFNTHSLNNVSLEAARPPPYTIVLTVLPDPPILLLRNLPKIYFILRVTVAAELT